MLFAKRALTTLCVGGFEYDDAGIVREQRTATRRYDAMIINDQNTHMAVLRRRRQPVMLHRIRLAR